MTLLSGTPSRTWLSGWSWPRSTRWQPRSCTSSCGGPRASRWRRMRHPRPARLPSSRVRVLAVVHHRNAGPGVFAEPVLAAGHELVEWLPHAAPAPSLDDIAAAIIFGGEPQVDDERRHPWLRPEKALLRQLLERN